MITKRRYIPQHITAGHFITVRCEITNDPSVAVRYSSPDDVLRFLNGLYGPSQPMEYKPACLKITFELEADESPDLRSHT